MSKGKNVDRRFNKELLDSLFPSPVTNSPDDLTKSIGPRPEEVEAARDRNDNGSNEGLQAAIFDRLDRLEESNAGLGKKLDTIANMLAEMKASEAREQEAAAEEAITDININAEAEGDGEAGEESEEEDPDLPPDEDPDPEGGKKGAQELEDELQAILDEDDDLKKAIDLKEELARLGDVESVEQAANDIPDDLADLIKAMPDEDEDPTAAPSASDDEDGDEESDGDEDEDDLQKALDFFSDAHEVHVVEGGSLHDLYKAQGHKYLRKYRTSSGKWAYVYPRKDKAGVSGYTAKHFKLDRLNAGDKLKVAKGHVEINDVKGGKVSFTDADGKQRVMGADAFGAMVLDSHKEAIKSAVDRGLAKRLDILERANKHGTDKQKARALEEVEKWKKDHGAYLKPDPSDSDMKGSGPQIKWANDIKSSSMPFINKWIEETKAAHPGIGKMISGVPGLLDQVKDASWWIDNRHRLKGHHTEYDNKTGRSYGTPPSVDRAGADKLNELLRHLPSEQRSAFEAHVEKMNNDPRLDLQRMNSKGKAARAALAGNPDGWKEHLTAKGLGFDNQEATAAFIEKHGDLCQEAWDKHGIVIAPPPGGDALDTGMMRRAMDDLEGMNEAFDVRETFAKHGIFLTASEEQVSSKSAPMYGLYDTGTRTVSLTYDRGKSANGNTLAHELFHALDHAAADDMQHGLLSMQNTSFGDEKVLAAYQQPVLADQAHLDYLDHPHEKLARGLEQFSRLQSDGTKHFGSGYWSAEHHAKNADKIALLGKEIGVTFKPEYIAKVKAIKKAPPHEMSKGDYVKSKREEKVARLESSIANQQINTDEHRAAGRSDMAEYGESMIEGLKGRLQEVKDGKHDAEWEDEHKRIKKKAGS